VLQDDLAAPSFRIQKDSGHSVLRLKYLKYLLVFDRVVNNSTETHKRLLELFTQRYLKNLASKVTDDHELLRTLLAYWNKYLKLEGYEKISLNDRRDVLSLLCSLLFTKEFL